MRRCYGKTFHLICQKSLLKKRHFLKHESMQNLCKRVTKIGQCYYSKNWHCYLSCDQWTVPWWNSHHQILFSGRFSCQLSHQFFALQWVILQRHLIFGSVSACSFCYMLAFLLASCFYFYILLILQCRNKINVFYQQGREIVILIIRGREKVILIHRGREKVIWAGGRKKVNGPGGRGQRPRTGTRGCGPKKSNTRYDRYVRLS